MSAGWVDQLLEPVSPEHPCGQNLDQTPELFAFDAFRIWGRQSWMVAGKNNVEVDDSPVWPEVERLALETLKKSHDLRVLGCLGAASLRTDGLPGLSGAIHVAAEWLERDWDSVFPPLEDGDPIARCSALNCFSDHMAVIDGLRRSALVNHRQLGRHSLRDIEVAPDKMAIEAAFQAVPLEELQAMRQAARSALDDLARIDSKMRDAAGTEAAPAFDTLQALLKQVERVLRDQIQARPDAVPEDGVEATAATEPRSGPVGAIASRQDAIRALDAVASYFRQTEPSSPVPLVVERAKRLVAKNFLEVLADIAPDALQQARAAGGLKDEAP